MKILVHEWVTGGGLAGQPLPEGWAREGRAMGRAIVEDFRAVPGVEVVQTRDARFGGDAGSDFLVMGAGEEASILGRWIPEVDFILVIAPETDGVLRGLAGLVEGVGGRSLGATAEAIALTADKAGLADWLQSRGIRTPRTRIIEPGDWVDEAIGGPYVLKPIDGAGAMDTYLVEAARDVPRAESRRILQPYIEGMPLSASYLRGPSGGCRLIGVGWQDVVIERGRFRYRGGILPAPTAWADGAVHEAVQAVEGLRGFIGVDFVRDREGSTHVIEINPRPTTSYVGLARLLAPGTIARAWLDLFGDDSGCADVPGMIDERSGPRLRFLADGTCVERKETDDFWVD